MKKTERGASEIFMIMMISSLLAFAGLAFDAGMAFNARRDATNLAASAARAGANDVSTDALYADGEARLSPTAELTARGALAGDARITESPDIYRLSDNELFVEVEITHETIFLKIIGWDEFEVTGSATARVQDES